MTYQELYNLPEGSNVTLNKTLSFYDEMPDNFPCPPSMSYAFAYNNARTCVKYLDTSNATDMSYMFGYDSLLTSVPNFDTSNVTNMNYMFASCGKLLNVPDFDTSNVTNMANMFYNCGELTHVDISDWDTSKVTSMNNMFSNCTKLQSLGAIDCSGLSSKNYYPLQNYSALVNFTHLGGFLGAKMSWDNNYGLKQLPNLTYQSCINVLNGLYDFTGNGETPNSNQGKLKVHANFLTTVGDDIEIAINKGWTVSA